MADNRVLSGPRISVLTLTAALLAGGCATDSDAFGSGTAVPASDPSR